VADDTNPHRLPRGVLPRRYDLTLTPDLEAATFDGAVDIDVDVHEDTFTVVLNAAELDIRQAWVTIDGQRHDATVSLDEEAQRVHLLLNGTLAKGEAVVSLRFSGILNDKLRGFYRSTYTDQDGAERLIACTQFEATDARRAFPCWDEPDCKATFAITLRIDPALEAVSNAAVVSDGVLDGVREVRFADSMVMSTYLVAFVVGPLEATAAVDVDGTPMRIVCPRGKAHLTPFGEEVGAFSLRYLADYFDLPYPGDSLDLVAIPDFAFGAMENLGCVTFRETLLLADPETTTQPELQNVVDVIAHELAHMWFGDLVTMKWWNGIWLNEAFATFMEMKVTDAFRPAWERWVNFGLSRSVAFDTDALATTRPIEYPVISPEDAEGMFDVLTYEKGAAVVRMLEQYLGEEAFRKGIRKYMTDHRYSNTETTDLWDAIESASGEPVRRIMDSWIFQGGHPIVSIELSHDRRKLRVSQQRFRYLADDGDHTRWSIPLQLRYSTGAGKSTFSNTLLLEEDSTQIRLDSPIEWVVANAKGHGFYRVRLVGSLHTAMLDHLDELSDIERYGFVDDTWAAVLAGASPVQDYLALAVALAGEQDVSVWRRLLGGLDQIERMLEGPSRLDHQEHMAELVGPVLERLGWEERRDDTDRERELRGVLIGALATTAGDAATRARVVELFLTVLTDPSTVEANVAAAVIRAAAATADAENRIVDTLIDRYRSATNPQEEQRFLFALAEVRDPDQFARALEFAASPEVRTQNGPYLLASCIMNRDNGARAWALVQERWEELNDRFPSNSIVRMLNGIRSIHDPALAAQVDAFLAEHPVPQGAKQLGQHLERMHVTVALGERIRSGS
jgi:puromycin-sensitive aminopeptidase